MKRKIRYLAMLLMSTSMVLCSCGGGSANSSASQSASAEASAEAAEDAAKKAEEEAAKKAEEEAKAAAEASRLAEEEAKKKAEEEAKAAEEALKKELEEYGIEAVEEGILVEIAAACAEEDYETAWELMHGEDYEASAKELEASGNDRVIVQTPHGRIGMYHTDGSASDFIGDYLLYFGDYNGDRREGHGIWLSVDYMETFEPPEYSYLAVCEWKDDRPADGAVHIETIMPAGLTTSDDGTLAGGFFDGDYMHSYVNSSGEESSSTEVYNNGYKVISGVVLEPNAKLPAKEKITIDNGQPEDAYMFSDGRLEQASYIDSIVGRRHSILGFSEKP